MLGGHRAAPLDSISNSHHFRGKGVSQQGSKTSQGAEVGAAEVCACVCVHLVCIACVCVCIHVCLVCIWIHLGLVCTSMWLAYVSMLQVYARV